MSTNVLSNLLIEVLKNKTKRELSLEDKETFHTNFALSIDDTVEKMRAEKRQAYEQLKNIAVQ
jgi:hypothetical protein